MTTTNHNLQDKSIVVIGGTTGLGLSAAQACVSAAANVVVVGRNPQSVHAAVDRLGPNGRGLAGDAADTTTAELAVQMALTEFGKLDALYHVAGGSGRRFGDGPLHDVTDEGWQATMELNLTSLFHSNRAAVRQFKEQGTGGVVLNMSSVLAFSPSPDHFATHAYAASKAACIGLTKSCAAYYAKENIRFNVIAPALVETPMSKRAQSNEPLLAFVAKKQPLDGGRIGRADDLDAAVVYLLSDESKFVTGQVLAVDGGWSVSEGV